MINSSLSGILQDSIGLEQCRQVLLVSRVGTVVASAAKESQPVSQSIGANVANTFGAGSQLGRLLGVGEQHVQLQRGRRQDLLLCQMPSGMILAVTFPVQVDEERATAFASDLIDQIDRLTPASDVYADRTSLAPELRDEAVSLIDKIFQAAA